MAIHTNSELCHSCLDKLETAHPLMRDWFINHVKSQFHNAHVSWAFRDKAAQTQALLEKKTKAAWPKSPHNFTLEGKPCSRALDLFQLDGKRAKFDPKFYFELNEYNEDNQIPIIWGGNFKTLADANHFELPTTLIYALVLPTIKPKGESNGPA
jgi:hypothetical protein